MCNILNEFEKQIFLQKCDSVLSDIEVLKKMITYIFFEKDIEECFENIFF